MNGIGWEVRVRDLSEGDMVDLEGDPYVKCAYHSNDDCSEEHGLIWEYEYGVVERVVLEDISPNYPAVVEFTNGEVIAFPRDHKLRVNQPSYLRGSK